MKCEIIRDLLLNYLDGLTNTVSNQVIKEHLNECDQCRKHYEVMKKVMEEKRITGLDRAAKLEINPFKKIRRIMIAAICLTVVLCALLFEC